jgi:acylglycerol lipase
MLRKLGRDPLVIKYTRIDTIYGLVNLMDAALSAVPQLPGNTLVLIGQKEDVMPNKAISAFSAALAEIPCVKVARYRSGYHMLLRDLKADVVLGDLAAWMANPERALPSSGDRIRSTLEGSGAPAPLAVICGRSVARP